jgi:hypothetical protein
VNKRGAYDIERLGWRRMKSKRQALLSSLSTALEELKGNGRKHIVVHIGSDGLSVFGSKPMRGYHDDMGGEVYFLTWFWSLLTKHRPNSVRVLDSASYYSLKVERVPTCRGEKMTIMSGWRWWLQARPRMNEGPTPRYTNSRIGRVRCTIIFRDTYVDLMKS